jgi:division protein CdvB (Snf7/Vps24/ESCRT-III family)
MKLKIFRGYLSGIEDLNEQINSWMDDDSIEIFNVLQSLDNSYIVISIFYKQTENIEYIKS